MTPASRTMLNRVTRGGLLMAAVAASLLVAANFYVSRQQSARHMENRLDRQLQQMATSLEIPLWSYDEQTIELICEAFLAGGDAAGIEVRAGQDRAPGNPVYQGRKPGSEAKLQGSIPIAHEGQDIGTVAISLSGEAEARHLRELLYGSILSALVILLGVALLLRWLINRSIAEPLRALGEWTDQVARGHYGQSAEQIADEELKPIATKFSEMSQQVAVREESLRESERRFRDLADLLPGIVFEADGEGRVTFLNRQALLTLGVSSQDVQHGLLLEELPAFEDREVMRGHLRKALVGEEEGGFECRCRDGEETVFPVLAYLSPVRRDGRVEGVRGVALDMTRQKELERRVTQTSKLEAIGTLAGGIAHDFNNILSAIIGFAELSLEGGELGDEDRENVEAVRQAGERAKELVRQILTFGRRSTGDLTPLPMSKVVREAVELAARTIPDAVRIDRNIPDDAGFVLASDTRIHQIVMNLCTNASHALPAGRGVLQVSLDREILAEERALTVNRLEPGPYVVLRVTDNGHGIPEEIRARIFDPFFTTKEQGRGTGMGLSVVHGIVVGYGGGVDVLSEMGEGTTIAVYLPLVELDEAMVAALAGAADGETEASAGPAPGSGQGEHILFVDDEEMLTSLARRTLESLGYRVTVHTDPLQALQIFQADPAAFDLVITDQTMPEISGSEVAAALLRERADVPVIICSGNAEILDHQRLREEGVREVLNKPIARLELATVVRRVLG